MKMKITCLTLLMVALMSVIVQAASRPAAVQDLRYSNTKDKLRIVLDLTNTVEYKDLYLENPSRLVVDIQNAILSSSVQKEFKVDSPLASRIRIGQFNPKTVRIVVESSSEINIFFLDGGPTGYRLVIDVLKVPTKPISEVKPPSTQPAEDKDKAKADAERKAKEEKERKAKEDAERKAKEEKELKAKEEAERKAKEEKERKAKEEAERKVKEEKERKAKEEAERKAKEEKERKAKEEKERKAKEEKERKAKEREKQNSKTEKDKPSTSSTPETPKSDVDVDLDKLMTLRGKIIVIDPGHGGNDAGAIGPSGLMEKTVTLNVALELEKLLVAEGATVIMTRHTDKTVSSKGASASAIEELQARCDVANSVKADIFISIHADSFTNPSARGTTGYYYSQTEGKKSIQLADCIRRALCEQIRTPSRGTKPCNFYVVKNTDMPATLIELAFISNPEEESIMGSIEGVLKCAQGIFDGIEDYFG